MTRLPDWRARLLSWAESVRGQPLRWGKTDCGSLARNALEICFGRDVVPHVPRYHTARQAKKVVKKHGHAVQIVQEIGATFVESLSFARMGDVIAMNEPEERVAGIALGVWCEQFVVAATNHGVVWLRRDALPLDAVAYSLWEIAEDGPWAKR